MNIPLLILICTHLISLGMGIGQHGKPKEGTWNGWASFLSAVIGIGLALMAVAAATKN